MKIPFLKKRKPLTPDEKRGWTFLVAVGVIFCGVAIVGTALNPSRTHLGTEIAAVNLAREAMSSPFAKLASDPKMQAAYQAMEHPPSTAQGCTTWLQSTSRYTHVLHALNDRLTTIAYDEAVGRCSILVHDESDALGWYEQAAQQRAFSPHERAAQISMAEMLYARLITGQYHDRAVALQLVNDAYVHSPDLTRRTMMTSLRPLAMQLVNQ